MNEDAVRIWILRAENDLKTGQDELVTPEPATDTVCFHMQQCCDLNGMWMFSLNMRWKYAMMNRFSRHWTKLVKLSN